MRWKERRRREWALLVAGFWRSLNRDESAFMNNQSPSMTVDNYARKDVRAPLLVENARLRTAITDISIVAAAFQLGCGSAAHRAPGAGRRGMSAKRKDRATTSPASKQLSRGVNGGGANHTSVTVGFPDMLPHSHWFTKGTDAAWIANADLHRQERGQHTGRDSENLREGPA